MFSVKGSMQWYTNLLNFQETFLVDKFSNGAIAESRCCVVHAVASMEKSRRRRKQKKKMNNYNFQNLRSICIYCHARGRASLWVVSCVAKVELQFGVSYAGFCPFFAEHLPYHFYRQ